MEASNATNKESISGQSAFKSSAKRFYVSVCEEAEKRRTPPGCDVHHINGNQDDNSSENLIIVSDSMHRWLHEQKTNPWMSCVNWRDLRKELDDC